VLCGMRVMTAACLLALGVSAGGQAPAGGQPPAGGQAPAHRSGCSLHLEITDEDGKALPKASVMLHGEHGTNRELSPDKNGEVRANLRAGMYDLFVSASGFVPQAQIVDLRSCKPVDVNLMLTIDAEHSENDNN